MNAFHPRRRTTGALALLVLATAPTAAVAAPPSAVVLACGQSITTNTVLARDVGPCAGDGLVIGADGVTVNLNGHRVVGTAGPGDNVGIRMQGRSRIVISGGTVTGFGAGVAIMGGSRNIVTAVTVEHNIGPINGSGDFGDGLAIFNSSDNVVRNNVIRHNGPFDGIGVFGAPSTRNLIADNLVELNNIARFVSQLDLMLNLDDGINLGAGLNGGTHNSVVGNTIRNNGLNGINACSVRGNPCITTDDTIAGNLVQANGFGDPLNPDPFDTGDGIHIVSIKPPGMDVSDFFPPTRELVANNTVVGNAGSGITVGSSSNRILNNRALGNASNTFDAFFDLQDISIENDCDANVWGSNTFGTADPACAGANGRQVPVPTPSAATQSAAARAALPAGVPLGRHLPSF